MGKIYTLIDCWVRYSILRPCRETVTTRGLILHPLVLLLVAAGSPLCVARGQHCGHRLADVHSWTPWLLHVVKGGRHGRLLFVGFCHRAYEGALS